MTMKSRELVLTVVAVTFALCMKNTQASLMESILYVHDSNGQLGKINLNTGAQEVIGDLGVVLSDIAFDPNGQLFGVDPSGLWSVDPKTAQTTFVGGANFTGTSMNALVFDSRGVLYAAGRDNTLYTIDPTTGEATSQGDIGFSSAGDLAFDASGRLFMSSTGNSLVEINQTTGAGREIGPFGFAKVLGLARDQNNTMYGYSYSNIFTIDTNTGAGTLLLNYAGSGLSQAFGGSFVTEAPEPGSLPMALTAAGTVLLVIRRRMQSGLNGR